MKHDNERQAGALREIWLSGIICGISLFCRYVFADDIMEMVSSDTYVKPYSRVCIQAYDDDKFLVAHEESGQTRAKYTCMQFLSRNKAIMQIKQGELSDVMGRSLCADSKLKLDGWIIIDQKSVMEQREDCSLVGGFNMQVYDKSLNKGVCDGYLGETRLESECLPGDGLTFYFRQAKCVPDGLYMYPAQKTYCLANWDEGNFNFLLLKHYRMNYLWVLQYPKPLQESRFTAYLMKDLYAAIDNSIPTTNYLSLSMSRQSPKTLNSMCFDDYEICSVLSDPCSYSEEIARTCAKTCGFCTDASPSVCQFSVPINGSWVDANHAENAANVLINATSIQIVGQETLHCINWVSSGRASRATDKEPPTVVTPSDKNNAYEQMLVTVSDNGCRPRFSCGKFTKLPSNSLFLQLTQTKLWPLVEKKDDPYECRKFIYANEKETDINPYRSRHENLFVSQHINSSVQCDLSQFHHFAVLFKDGVRCSGQLTQSARKNSIQLSFPECSVQRLRHRFTCLESSQHLPDNDQLLVTKSHESPPKVHCWLFPSRPSNVFHIIEATQCNSLMKRRLRKGRLRPVATFTRDPSRKSDTIEIIPDEDESHIVQSVPLNDTVIVVQKLLTTAVESPSSTTKSPPAPTKKYNNDVMEDKATTDGNLTSTTSDSGTKSPVVAAAVVVTLIIMQIPLLCKCKC